jgi:6-phosphogluconolactonase
LDPQIRIFPSPYILAESFAQDLVSRINESAAAKKTITISLSGGSTPELLFSLLGDHFAKSAEWDAAHFFWGDERCVESDNSESNYGMAKRKLFDKLEIPATNIHRIRGEADPDSEAVRYESEIKTFTSSRNGLPKFDIVVLGMGEDGHTASVFPQNIELMKSDNICSVSVHPVSGQKRVTITGKVINNADMVVFLVTGKKKAEIVENIITKKKDYKNFPSSCVVPTDGKLFWFLDMDAASILEG